MKTILNARNSTALTLTTVALVCLSGMAVGNPVLTVGVWKNITPAGANPSGSSPFLGLAIDPNNADILYAGQCGNGVWKTTDAGSNWARLGDASKIGSSTTGYIDNPSEIEVDPGNSQHLYASHAAWCGDSRTWGFWESKDAGKTWVMPAGFVSGANQPGGSLDVGMYTVDPGDFKHVLVGFHFVADAQFGFLETTDGFATFVLHKAPFTLPAGTPGINFLHDPAHGIGNGRTWLITLDGAGYWRSADAGSTWTKVSNLSGKHGGFDSRLYYSQTGVVYAGGVPYPTRSTDNGMSWTSITDKMYGYYYGVYGDGVNLYATNCLGGSNVGVFTSADSDGRTWTAQSTVAEAVATIRYDATNHIMYGASMPGGIYAMKTQAGTAVAVAHQKAAAQTQRAKTLMLLEGRGGRAGTLYNIKGAAIDPVVGHAVACRIVIAYVKGNR